MRLVRTRPVAGARKSRHFALFVAAALVAVVSPLHAGTGLPVAGEKLDSGLGQLPHYSQWADPKGKGVVRLQRRDRVLVSTVVEGEKIDSGLGDLPHYSKWADASGRDPLGRQGVKTARAAP